MSIRRQLGPLITRLDGPLGNHLYHTRPDGNLEVRRRRTKPGPATTGVAWEYCKECVRRLDAAARDMDYDQRGAWDECPPKTEATELSWQGHFYQLNIRRMLFGFPGLISPPDKFLSYAARLHSDACMVPISPPRLYHVWVSGTQKDGDDFGESEGFIEPPSPLEPEPLNLTCLEANYLMTTKFITGELTIQYDAPPPPEPGPCDHASGTFPLGWAPFPFSMFFAMWHWFDDIHEVEYEYCYDCWCDPDDPASPTTYSSRLTITDITWFVFWDTHEFEPLGQLPVYYYTTGLVETTHDIIVQLGGGCGNNFNVDWAVHFETNNPGSRRKRKPLTSTLLTAYVKRNLRFGFPIHPRGGT